MTVKAAAGLRRGEILALQYPDVDWFVGGLVVSRAISKCRADDGVHKWEWKLGPTKNRRIRRVGLTKEVLGVLANLKQAASDPNGFIFAPELAGLAGSRLPFIDPDYFDASIFATVRQQAGLPDTLRFRDLRHFFASMLIAQGESPKHVCDQMGHSSIQVTFDAYGHLFPQARREATERLERAMFAGRRTALVEDMVETPPAAGHWDGVTRMGVRGSKPEQ
jgi:integrase